MYAKLDDIYRELARDPYLQNPVEGAAPLRSGEIETRLVDSFTASADESPALGPTPEEEVVRRLEEWAAAWSRQDLETYLDYYAEDFVPSGRLSRGGWEAQRYQRLSDPAWIQVGLSDFVVHREGEDIRVELIQQYLSSDYHERSSKVFVFGLRRGEWRILSEITRQVLVR